MPPHCKSSVLRRRLLAGAALAVAGLPGWGCVPDAPSSAGPQDRFPVTLAWEAPATDALGGPLEDLSGFRLYYGQTSPLTASNATVVEVGAATRHTLEDLPAGRYFFAVSAMDESGNESELSAEVAVQVGPP